MSAFVLSHATAAAQNVLADRTHFVLPAERWDAFVALLERDERPMTESSRLPRPSDRLPGRVTDFRRPELIRPEHEVADFDCGSEAQTVWLQEHALQAARAESSRVYVSCASGTNQVAGFYALAAGAVAREKGTVTHFPGTGPLSDSGS